MRRQVHWFKVVAGERWRDGLANRIEIRKQGVEMKKLFLAATAIVALAAGSASAADLSRPVYKAAPPPAPVYSWTGCYLGAGGGYGMWNQDEVSLSPGFGTVTQTGGGRGWFGTVQVGCDYQIASNWVIGAFVDWDFGSIKGNPHFPVDVAGEEKEKWAWGAGGRIGYLVTPQLLTYFAAGYTEAHFDQINQINEFFPGGAPGTIIPSHTYKGWFIGTGYEYALGWFPGLFWKTEYRYADYRSDRLAQTCVSTALCGALGPTGTFYDMHKYVQTVRSELVWRFNWGSPVVAKY
jgi:outer membrane immunogenic protein